MFYLHFGDKNMNISLIVVLRMSLRPPYSSQIKFCIIHYKNKSSYNPLKDVNELNKDRIRQAKSEHEKQPPSSNKHYEQCKSIPKTIDNNVHGIHNDPCYKTFTRILSDITKRKPESQRSSDRSSAGSSSNMDPAWLFPDECHFCKKIRVQIKGNRVMPALNDRCC